MGRLRAVGKTQQKERIAYRNYLARRFAPEVAKSPFADCSDDGNKTLAHAGQTVFDLGRNDAIILSLNQACVSKSFQLTTQDSWSDFLAPIGSSKQATLDLAIAQRAVFEVPQDSDFIFPADHFLARQDRAATGSHRFIAGHGYSRSTTDDLPKCHEILTQFTVSFMSVLA